MQASFICLAVVSSHIENQSAYSKKENANKKEINNCFGYPKIKNSIGAVVGEPFLKVNRILKFRNIAYFSATIFARPIVLRLIVNFKTFLANKVGLSMKVHF